MFLKKDPRPNGRLYLSIVKSYRDPKTKVNKQKAVLLDFDSKKKRI